MCIRFSLMRDIRFRIRNLNYHKAVKKISGETV
jgi:hypothetical protein